MPEWLKNLHYEEEVKEDICKCALHRYPSENYECRVGREIKGYKDGYKWDVTCQGSVLAAIRCFPKSDEYVIL